MSSRPPGEEGPSPTAAPAGEAAASGVGPDAPRGRRLIALSIAALGVVYGDIGTSPLYALRECFTGHAAVEATRANVLGVLSLIFWALVLIVCVKYLAIVLRADNRGEGGILALMARLQAAEARAGQTHAAILFLGIFGAALLFGDGMITPAISVLSAVEGLAIFQPALSPFVGPITILVLVALFLIQSRGTGGVGAIFGPITLAWFLLLAVLGVRGIVHDPSVVAAVNPLFAVRFFVENGWAGVAVLGAVFLVVTGSEALYADMGHFGRRPIRVTWFRLVFPSLLANYFGQGALLLAHPEAVQNPFYLLVPSWALLPAIAVSTAAACIASQAVISGAFSLTRQAVQLGFCPRLEIVHTSAAQVGQIYVPAVNWTLLVAVVLLVLGFGDSSSLAGAYGIAVSSTMAITAALAFLVARRSWKWSPLAAGALFGSFLAVDLAFLGANSLKVLEGGWFPLLVAAMLFGLMTTWKRGRAILGERLREAAMPMDLFLDSLRGSKPTRVAGTAVFMTGSRAGVPPALLHNFKHNKILHERIVLLTSETSEFPHVQPEQRVELKELTHGFHRVVVRYGFMESPDMATLTEDLLRAGLRLNLALTSFFLGKETLIAGRRGGMAAWRKTLFGWMSRNARPATAYFGLPPNRVVELGAQIEL